MTEPEASPRTRGLWAYNIRILLGNSYWLIVTPVAAAQLVLFWNMATAGLSSPGRAAQTIEVLAPILGAFLCAHVLAPEQAGVRELVFARPISLEKVLLVRAAVMFAFVLAVLAPALLLYQVVVKGFPLGLVVLAALASMLFLSTLAMTAANATNNPLLGLGVAGAFWALDLARGTDLNALVTLHGLADRLREAPMSDQWVLGKLVLLALAGLLYLWSRRALGRPPAPRRWVAAVRGAAVALVVSVLYLGSGAGYKIAYGIQHEAELGNRALLWYKTQFGVYGPLPVARLFGPAFPLYMQPQGGGPAQFSWTGFALPTPGEVARMRQLVARYPRSIWADNATFEIARDHSRRPAAEPWAVTVHEAGGGHTSELVEADLEAARAGYLELVERYPSSAFAPIALEQAAAHSLSMLDFATAVSCYERLVRDYPTAREATQAGLGLSALYLRQGRWQEAIRAADIAAAAAPWDVQAEVLLTSAQVARQAGDGDGARQRYQRAHEAAREARQGASAHRERVSGLSGGQIVLRSDGVMRECEQALAGELRNATPPAPPTGVAVIGRLERRGRPAAGARVALTAELDATGRPSPFVASPAAQGEADASGTFRLDGVAPGEYRVMAFACRQARGEPVWEVPHVELPVHVGTSAVTLPTYTFAAAQPPARSVQPGPPPGREPGAGRGQVRGGGRGPTRGGRIGLSPDGGRRPPAGGGFGARGAGGGGGRGGRSSEGMRLPPARRGGR